MQTSDQFMVAHSTVRKEKLSAPCANKKTSNLFIAIFSSSLSHWYWSCSERVSLIKYMKCEWKLINYLFKIIKCKFIILTSLLVGDKSKSLAGCMAFWGLTMVVVVNIFYRVERSIMSRLVSD
jgi:hypothetical protein